MKQKILIVEDNPVIGHLYRMAFEREGFEAQIANDGQAGFYAIYDFKPDLILLDLMLPFMNGVAILGKIRAQKQFQKLPIFVFSSTYGGPMMTEAIAAGATATFNKADPDVLQQVIDAVKKTLNPQVTAPAATPVPKTPGQAGAGESAVVTTPKEATAQAKSPTSAQAELRDMFFATASDTVFFIRSKGTTLNQAVDDASRTQAVTDLFRKVHALTGHAAVCGLETLSHYGSVIEALLLDMQDKPANVNPSTLRTLNEGVDLLDAMLAKRVDSESANDLKPHVLVVDEDEISRRAITLPLRRAGLRSTDVGGFDEALGLLKDGDFVLVFVDTENDPIKGNVFSTQVRSLPAHQKTPVILATSMEDFKMRTGAKAADAGDLIAKPVVLNEVAVKAWTSILRARLS